MVRVHPGQPARVAQWQSIRLISGRPVVRSHPCAPAPASSAAEHPHDRRKVRGPIPRPRIIGPNWAWASPRRRRCHANGCAGPTPACCTITARWLTMGERLETSEQARESGIWGDATRDRFGRRWGVSCRKGCGCTGSCPQGAKPQIAMTGKRVVLKPASPRLMRARAPPSPPSPAPGAHARIVVQSGRIPGSGPGGCWFESSRSDHCRPAAMRASPYHMWRLVQEQHTGL